MLYWYIEKEETNKLMKSRKLPDMFRHQYVILNMLMVKASLQEKIFSRGYYKVISIFF